MANTDCEEYGYYGDAKTTSGVKVTGRGYRYDWQITRTRPVNRCALDGKRCRGRNCRDARRHPKA